MTPEEFKAWLPTPQATRTLDDMLKDNQRVDDGPMRKQCAWCQQEIAPGREPTTHTICTPCYLREFDEVDF